jgi:hypothetical protein
MGQIVLSDLFGAREAGCSQGIWNSAFGRPVDCLFGVFIMLLLEHWHYTTTIHVVLITLLLSCSATASTVV